MIIGKYVRQLLDERIRVILPGFGNLQVILPKGGDVPSGKRISPPGLTVRFDPGHSKDDGELAGRLAAGEGLEREEAHQRVLELIDAIKFELDKGEEYLLPDAVTFSRDADGKIHFETDPNWVLEPDMYGLESMDLLELEDLPDQEAAEKWTQTQTSPNVTPLAPPIPKPKARRWRVIWLVAAVLVVVLVILLLVPSGENGNDSVTGRFFKKKADREMPEQDQNAETQQDNEAGDQAIETEGQVRDTKVETTPPESEPDQSLPLEEPNSFFIIAGSFKSLKNASDLQDQLNEKGFQAEVLITENRMYRVSVASYATKKEAEKGLAHFSSEPDLQSCWLLSN